MLRMKVCGEIATLAELRNVNNKRKINHPDNENIFVYKGNYIHLNYFCVAR